MEKSAFEKISDVFKKITDKLSEIIESSYKNPVVFGIIALFANIIFITRNFD